MNNKLVYILKEDCEEGCVYSVFTKRELAEKALDDILLEYTGAFGSPMTEETLANKNIYVAIEEATVYDE